MMVGSVVLLWLFMVELNGPEFFFRRVRIILRDR